MRAYFFITAKGITAGNGLDRSAKPSIWGKVDFLRFTSEKTDEGLFNTTPFLLEKETGQNLFH